MEALKFEIPYPPSVNRAWRMVRVGRSARMVLSREARAYRTEACARLAALSHRGFNGSGPIDGALCVLVTLHPPDRRKRDIDNAMKCVLDALQHAGVIRDDAQIGDLRVVRGAVVPGGRADIEISGIDN